MSQGMPLLCLWPVLQHGRCRVLAALGRVSGESIPRSRWRRQFTRLFWSLVRSTRRTRYIVDSLCGVTYNHFYPILLRQGLRPQPTSQNKVCRLEPRSALLLVDETRLVNRRIEERHFPHPSTSLCLKRSVQIRIILDQLIGE